MNDTPGSRNPRASRRRVLQTVSGLTTLGVLGAGSSTTVAADPGDQQWRFETGDLVWSSPTVVGGTVFIGSATVPVHALDAADGTEQWRFETGYWVISSPTVVDGTVFVGCFDDNVYALDAADGTEQWRFQTDDGVGSSPTVVDGTVFVGSYDNNVYALDAADGTEQWRFETDDYVFSSPTVVDGTVFVGSSDNNVYALDAADGTEQWRFQTDDGVDSSPTVVDGTVFVGSNDNNVYALDAADGTEQWRFETDDVVRSSPTVVNGTVFVGSLDDNVYALDAGVEGSSEDSGVNLGTLGHHHTWAERTSRSRDTNDDDDEPADDEEVDAAIRSFTTLGGATGAGESVTSTVEIVNTGNVEHRFFVGYSVIAPDGQIFDNEATTGEPVTLAPDEQTTIELSWEATPDHPEGPYDVVTAVWEEDDRHELETQLARETNEDAFTLDEGSLPAGTTVRSPVTVEESPYTDVQTVEFANLTPDGDALRGEGLRITLDREVTSDDEFYLTITINAPDEALAQEVLGYGSSQLLLLFDDERLSVKEEGLQSQVDGGTPVTLDRASLVSDLATVAGVATTGGLSELVKEAIIAGAEEVAEDWVTSQMTFEVPPAFNESDNPGTIEIDFSTETVPEATSPTTFDEYTLEVGFTVDSPSDDPEPAVTIISDLRGRTVPIDTASEDGNPIHAITGSAVTVRQLPLEYRAQHDVPRSLDDGTGETGDETDTSRDDVRDQTTDDDMEVPGFGVPSTLAALGSAGYLLKRRLSPDDRDSG